MRPQVTIEATVQADLATVWSAWTEGEHITGWNFADPSWHCPWAKSDVRVGGAYSARMEARDSSFGFEFGATYTLVEHHKALHSTMGDDRKIWVTFEEVPGGVHVVERFEAEDQNPFEMQQAGWQMILNNFKAYAEGL